MHCNSCGKTICKDAPLCEHCGRPVGGWRQFWNSLDTADFSKWLPDQNFWVGLGITAALFAAMWSLVSYVKYARMLH